MDIWDQILDILDDGDKAACILGVNFKKAFKHMDHGHCLRSLVELGASPGSVGLMEFFLKDHLMTLHIGEKNCGFRKIIRGSPQGSVLGCLFYCVTTQILTKNLSQRLNVVPAPVPVIANMLPPADLGENQMSPLHPQPYH